MSTDESIMEELLDRATNPANDTVDELGVQTFCIVVRSNIQLVHRAQEMIINKIRSRNVVEAQRAIALLEECMSQCGSDFQDEASKFRFLNELIRLVSKKYQGDETPHEVKQRIMECLLFWTTEYPQKQKIREAYDMLHKECGIEHGPIVKRPSVLGELDEEMFAKLIKSKDPENYKRANLLLQYRMNQVARRNEFLLQHKSVVQEVQNTVLLLNQMLDTYDGNDIDGYETMHELYKNCKKQFPIFQHMPNLIDQSDTELMATTLKTNEALIGVMTRYKELVESPKRQSKSGYDGSGDATTTNVAVATPKKTNPTAAITTTNTTTTTSGEDFINELLGDLLPQDDKNVNVPTETAVPATRNNLDTFAELCDIFGDINLNNKTPTTSPSPSTQASTYPTELLKYTQLLEPESVSGKSVDANSEKLENGDSGKTKKTTNDGTHGRKLQEIDALTDELFHKTMPGAQERISIFKRETEKMTLNDLARECFAQTLSKAIDKKQNVNLPTTAITQSSMVSSLEDVPILDDSPNTSTFCESTKPVEIALSAPIATTAQTHAETSTNAIDTNAIVLPIKHLSEISIDLDNVTPSDEQRTVLDDDDLQLTLNFTQDRPSKHVTVIVITAQNKSKFVIKDFQFEASVKKPCKVRLLPPTDNEMPPHKPFRPAAPINQIMLLLNPTGKVVDITCIVGYKLGDDPDPIKESIIASGIPYVE